MLIHLEKIEDGCLHNIGALAQFTLTLISKMPNNRNNLTEEQFIEIHNNRYKTWYDGAGIILYNEKNQVLLVQDDFGKKWSFPKGHVELCDDDEPINTAIRETMEEAGLKLNKDYTINMPKPIMVHWNKYFFEATLLEYACLPTTGVNECAYKWCSRSYIQHKIWKNTNSYVKNFTTNYEW